MIQYVISIAFFIFNASAHNDDESSIIETKTKIHIANQIYKNESKSFINKNFDKYKDSIFKVIPEMIANCKQKKLKNDMYLFEDYNFDASCRTASEWNYLVLYNIIYSKLHKKENITFNIKQHYSSYQSKIDKAIMDCDAYYKTLKLDWILNTNISDVEIEGNNQLYGKFYNDNELVYNTDKKQFGFFIKSEKEPHFDEIHLVKFDDYMKVVDTQFYKYRFVINNNINDIIETADTDGFTYIEFKDIAVKILDSGEYSFIRFIGIEGKYREYNIDVIIPGIINGKQTLYSDDTDTKFNRKGGDLIFRSQGGTKVKILRTRYENAKGCINYVLFRCLSSVNMIDLTGADTSGITDMSQMFQHIPHTTHTLKVVKGLTVTDKVKNMSKMFYMCQTLTNIDMSNFDTQNVEDMSQMFFLCSKLRELDLSKFNTTKVTKMSCMFWGCYDLEKLDLSKFDTKNVRSMSQMFLLCQNIKVLDLSSFNTEQLNNMESMFFGMTNLQTLNIGSFNTKNVNDMGGLFHKCSSITSLDLSNFIINSKCKTGYMFSECNSLTNINWSKRYTLAENAYDGCNSLIRKCKLNENDDK